MPNTPPIQRDAAKVELKPSERARDAAKRWVRIWMNGPSEPDDPESLLEAFATFERDLRLDDALRDKVDGILAHGYNEAARAPAGWRIKLLAETITRARLALNERNPKP